MACLTRPLGRSERKTCPTLELPGTSSLEPSPLINSFAIEFIPLAAFRRPNNLTRNLRARRFVRSIIRKYGLYLLSDNPRMRLGRSRPDLQALRAADKAIIVVTGPPIRASTSSSFELASFFLFSSGIMFEAFFRRSDCFRNDSIGG